MDSRKMRETYEKVRSFSALVFFLAFELRGDVELFWHPFFVHIDAPVLVMLLLVRSHVACVSKHSQIKKWTSPTAFSTSLGQNTCRILRSAVVNRTPFVLLAPWTSLLWERPCSHALLLKKVQRTCRLDQRQFGAPWRKRTAALSSLVDTHSFARVCISQTVCSWSHRPHVLLGRVSTPAVSRWPVSVLFCPTSFADVLPASCRTPVAPSKPQPRTMCSSLCRFNVSGRKMNLGWFFLSPVGREDGRTHNSRWAHKIDLSVSILFEARALLTCRCEPRHWISMVSSGMKSASSPPVSTPMFSPGCS